LTGGTYFIVGTFHQDKYWGYGTIGAAVGNQPPNWNRSIKFIVHKDSKIWYAGLEGTVAYKELESQLPSHFPSLSPQSPLADDFKFPWSASQIWCYTSSWHSGWSVDFAPSSSVPSAERWFLSSSEGYLTLTCDDNYQASVQVQNGSLGNMGYAHLDSSTIPDGIVNTDILQGQKLARAYDGTQGAGWYDIGQPWPWPSCTPDGSCHWSKPRSGCCYLQYMTSCGAGTGAHFHWTLPGSNTTVDGWTIGADGIWRKSGEADRGVGSCFASSNTSDNTSPTTEITSGPNGWITTDSATFNWSGSDNKTSTGDLVYSYKLDSGSWSSWTSSTSKTYNNLSDGSHTFKVKAKDEAGNEDESPASRRFSVDTADPNAPTIHPGCNASDSQWQNTCRDPDFSWRATDPNGSDGSGIDQTPTPGTPPPAIIPPPGVTPPPTIPVPSPTPTAWRDIICTSRRGT
jgi:hypothetical protein